MRVAPGESYATIHDWDYEHACLRERAIANLESIARERCEEFFLEHAQRHANEDLEYASGRVLDALIEHDAVVLAICLAVNGTDECNAGHLLKRATDYARIKWTNENWKAFAAYAVDHRGDVRHWPINDNEIGEGTR